ncbi:MAG: PD-(D/E)XK nuclease family protein [Bacillota bacterium]
MHKRYQKHFARMGVLVARELQLNENSPIPRVAILCKRYRIRGRLDFVVRKDKLYVVEFKSASEKSFLRMVKSGPYKHYIDQLQLYLFLSGIRDGLILLENKNTQETHEFYYELDSARIRWLCRKMDCINHHVFSLMLPPPEHHRDSFECVYCDYTEACWSSEPERYLIENRKYLLGLLLGE